MHASVCAPTTTSRPAPRPDRTVSRVVSEGIAVVLLDERLGVARSQLGDDGRGAGECDPDGTARAAWFGMAAGVPLRSACRVNRMAYGRAARVSASAPEARAAAPMTGSAHATARRRAAGVRNRLVYRRAGRSRSVAGRSGRARVRVRSSAPGRGQVSSMRMKRPPVEVGGLTPARPVGQRAVCGGSADEPAAVRRCRRRWANVREVGSGPGRALMPSFPRGQDTRGCRSAIRNDPLSGPDNWSSRNFRSREVPWRRGHRLLPHLAVSGHVQACRMCAILSRLLKRERRHGHVPPVIPAPRRESDHD